MGGGLRRDAALSERGGGVGVEFEWCGSGSGLRLSGEPSGGFAPSRAAERASRRQ